MKTDQYSILFSSLTGNTKKLADAIHETLPEEGCEYFGAIKTPVPSSELLYIGFWTDKGNADNETLTLLSTLKNRRIFLFGTAGFGGSDAYFKDPRTGQTVHRSKQYHYRRIYVSGKNAAVCAGALYENERKS